MIDRNFLALMASSAIATLLWANIANAQRAPAQWEMNVEEGSDERVSDIVVTAQRRSQNLQEVPISVAAATGERLGDLGVRSTSDLGVVAPAVTFGSALGTAAVTIRGVGGTGSAVDESANAIYIDGVYMQSPQALLFQFNNVERIEILKGPQGTLFGRNSSGGLIQIITKTPSRQAEFDAELSYGNYGTVRAAATMSGALSDSFFVSLSGIYEHQNDGWGHNVATGGDAYEGGYGGARLKAVWQIGPDTKLTGTALYSRSRLAGNQGSQILAGEQLLGGGGARGFYDQNQNAAGYARTIQKNYALTLNHDLGWASFTSITSRDVVDADVVVDADLSPIDLVKAEIINPARSWTQELQLASPTNSKLQWLTGLFYYHNDLSNAPFRTSGLAFSSMGLAYADTNARRVTDSYAAYGQATIPLADGTNVTAGLRYTIDKSSTLR